MNYGLASKPGVGISDAAQIAKKYGAKGAIVLLADDDGYFCGFSWGVNKSWCKRLGEQLDYLVDKAIPQWEARNGVVRLRYLLDKLDKEEK